MPRDYDSTVARIAGNIASGISGIGHPEGTLNAEDIAQWSVKVARLIVDETRRTAPTVSPEEQG